MKSPPRLRATCSPWNPRPRGELTPQITVHLMIGTTCQRKSGGARRNRTADEGFADPCLATWLPRLNSFGPPISPAHPKQKTHRPAFWWWVAFSSQAEPGFLPVQPPHTRGHTCAARTTTTHPHALLWVSHHKFSVAPPAFRGQRKFPIPFIEISWRMRPN